MGGEHSTSGGKGIIRGFSRKTCRNGKPGRSRRRRADNIKACERNRMGKGGINSCASGQE
jgi:hypothetical protein